MTCYRLSYIVAALLCAAVAAAHAQDLPTSFKNFSIPSSAMAPTLVPGDVIITDPSAYDGDAEPQRGDVVIFLAPDGNFFVKRIMAIGGEEIFLRDGTVFIEGEPLQRTPSTDTTWDDTGTVYDETMPDGRVIQTLDLIEGSRADNTAVFKVPDGHFFVMGDNRDNSNDSRFTVGTVARDKIFAKARRVIFSSTLSRIGLAVE